MIKEFVTRFDFARAQLAEVFSKAHPSEYFDIVKAVVLAVAGDAYNAMDSERIHQIDDGDYQGTLLFVIGAQGYQPEKYWYVRVDYGSCSTCDTLQGIQDYSRDDPPTLAQVNQYMTLALHIVQGLKLLQDEE
jgi:hypothetical protein